MNIEIRAATPGERLYAFKQSMHIGEHSGAVGCLRGDMGEDGQEFHTDWEHCCGHLWTSEFLVDREKVLDALRDDERYGGALKDHDALTAYCEAHPESEMGRHDREYAFRLDTEQYTYFLRLCPDNLEFDFELCPYRRDLFELHTEQAEQGIRFIGPDHRERFTIPDGDSIRIFTGSGDTRDRVARYVDKYHVELFTDSNSSRIYLLHDFAAQAKRTGSRVIPLRSSLPDKCFSITSAADEVIIITKGEMFQRPAGARAEGVTAREGATAANEAMGVTKAQEAAMLFGSIYGWDKPGADPSHYDEQGAPIRPKHQDRGDAR
ncbi:MAG: hypothetical protein K2K53_02130 [Oscillospiraceae bacterium]|nr:hypothetical protein [Oscillospiraceae bacterium]